jgi:hypothetical protein
LIRQKPVFPFLLAVFVGKQHVDKLVLFYLRSNETVQELFGRVEHVFVARDGDQQCGACDW